MNWPHGGPTHLTCPAVCFDEGKGSTDAFEFVAVRESIWSADNPNAAIKALSEASA